MGQTCYYSVYGLTLAAPLALPELPACSPGPVDVIIRRAALPVPAADLIVNGRYVAASATVIDFYWPPAGAFRLTAGRLVEFDQSPGGAESVLRQFILGPVLGALLHQRGFLVLHASAVELGGQAVLFMGASGWGKSTMAGALRRRGHRLINDDVAAIRWQNEVAIVQPGFPQLKLWPAAADALGEDGAALPRLVPVEEKRARSIDEGVVENPLPLGRIYVLAQGDQLAITPLAPRDALVELIRHSYSVRLVTPTGAAPEHFRQCARLSGAIPIRTLARPLSLPALTTVAAAVEADPDDHSPH